MTYQTLQIAKDCWEDLEKEVVLDQQIGFGQCVTWIRIYKDNEIITNPKFTIQRFFEVGNLESNRSWEISVDGIDLTLEDTLTKLIEVVMQ